MRAFCSSRTTSGFFKQRCQVLEQGGYDTSLMMYGDAVTMFMPTQKQHAEDMRQIAMVFMLSVNSDCLNENSEGLSMDIECVMRHAPLTFKNQFDEAIPLLKEAGKSTYDDSVTQFVTYLKDKQTQKRLGPQFNLVDVTSRVAPMVTGPRIEGEVRDDAALAYWGELIMWIGQEYLFFVMHASARKRAIQAGTDPLQVTAVDIMQEIQSVQEPKQPETLDADVKEKDPAQNCSTIKLGVLGDPIQVHNSLFEFGGVAWLLLVAAAICVSAYFSARSVAFWPFGIWCFVVTVATCVGGSIFLAIPKLKDHCLCALQYDNDDLTKPLVNDGNDDLTKPLVNDPSNHGSSAAEVPEVPAEVSVKVPATVPAVQPPPATTHKTYPEPADHTRANKSATKLLQAMAGQPSSSGAPETSHGDPLRRPHTVFKKNEPTDRTSPGPGHTLGGGTLGGGRVGTPFIAPSARAVEHMQVIGVISTLPHDRSDTAPRRQQYGYSSLMEQFG